MAEILTNKALRLLKLHIEKLKSTSANAQMDYGQVVGVNDGDGYHDETAALLEREKLVSQRNLYVATQLLRDVGILAKPLANDRIELGHVAGIDLVDQSRVNVTVLPVASVEVLLGLFDQDINLLVSDISPWGQALLGKAVNMVVNFPNDKGMVKSIKVDDKVFD